MAQTRTPVQDVDASGRPTTRTDDHLVPAESRRRRGPTAGSAAWAALPVLTFVAIVAAWGAVVQLFSVPSYLLPGPASVVARMISDRDSLLDQAVPTLAALGLGLLLCVLVAIPLGLIIALSRLAKQTVYPVVMFIQLVPKIAIAPLLLVWLGFSVQTKVTLVVLIAFFPLLMSSIAGFVSLDERLLYLTRSMGASRLQTFWRLRLPAALPIIFSGIKTCATIAITGALVAEFLGSNEGLGYALLRASSQLDTEYIFAILAILTLIGIAINYLIEALEWWLTPWQRHRRQRSKG